MQVWWSLFLWCFVALSFFSVPAEVWWVAIFTLSKCIISKIQDLCRAHCESQSSGCTLRHCLLARRGRMFSREKGKRGTTQSCGLRDERSEKETSRWKRGWSEVPTESQCWGRGTPNYSSWGRKQGFFERRSFWITRQHSNNKAFQ